MFKLLKKIFNYKCHVKFLFNPFLRVMINSLGSYCGVNHIKRDIPVIVSLTSYEERFDELPKTIYSLLNQTLKPDRIILWLSDKNELNNIPYELSCFIKNGLEIKFRKDLGSYTKAYYAFKEIPESIIVTADDDIYYSKDWLKTLYLSYVSNPNDIQVHRAHRVKIINKKIAPYEEWDKQIDSEDAAFSNFLTGVGGVLYPPNCFSNEVLREDVFSKNAPNADDLWFWIMAVTHGKKIRVVKNHCKTLTCTNVFTQLFSKTLYKQNIDGGNDKQLENLLNFYGNNVMSKLYREL